MPRVDPFRALRYDRARVRSLASALCPPYDVISPSQRRELVAASPFNVVRLELPQDDDGVAADRYQAAAQLLARWRADGELAEDPLPSFTLYETRFHAYGRDFRRRDLIGALGVEPWGKANVLPHEKTMRGPKADRLALMRATGANLSPIWVLARQAPSALEEAWTLVEQRAPWAAFAVEGVEHRLWIVHEPGLLESISAGFVAGGPLYIADGHHRYETAQAFRDEAEDRLPGARNVLAVISDARDPGLLVLPTHRIVRGSSIDALRARLDPSVFSVKEISAPAADQDAIDDLLGHGDAPAFLVVGNRGESRLLVRVIDPEGARARLSEGRGAAWKSLDLAVLHGLVLDPVLRHAGLDAERGLGYTRDVREALHEVSRSPNVVAVFPRATRVEQVLAVADAGERMPEKSTYFWPKPPTGLAMRALRAR